MKSRPVPTNPGETLKYARIHLEMSKQRVLSKLRVNQPTLEAIEAWQLNELPENPYLVPLIRRYCELVKVDFKKLSADFPDALKRDDKPITPKRKPIERDFIVVGNYAKLLVVALFLLVVFGYVALQSSSLGSKPSLEIYEPASGQVVNTEKQEVRGKTSKEAQVFINGGSILVDEQGNFKSVVVLQDGLNEIVIKVVNNLGAEREEVISVVKK